MNWRLYRDRRSDVDTSATENAHAQAEFRLKQAKARRTFVKTITAELNEARRENNFAARIRAAYGEGR